MSENLEKEVVKEQPSDDKNVVLKTDEDKKLVLGKQEKTVYLVLSCIMLVALFGVFWFGKDYLNAKEEYDTLLNKYVVEQEISSDTQMRWDIDWESLYKINPDIVAWVIIPDSEINYPVVQTIDNDKYLNTTFEGVKNSCGAIFMNCYNLADFSDQNTVIYGHNMRNGSMFHTLNLYADEGFYQAHQEVWICTPSWQRKYNIISVHTTKDMSSTYDIEFPTQESFESHIGNEVSQTLYETGNVYDTSLPIVTLSTCRGLHSTTRMILVCQPEYEILVP